MISAQGVVGQSGRTEGHGEIGMDTTHLVAGEIVPRDVLLGHFFAKQTVKHRGGLNLGRTFDRAHRTGWALLRLLRQLALLQHHRDGSCVRARGFCRSNPIALATFAVSAAAGSDSVAAAKRHSSPF